MKMKFYRCAICGQIILMVEETGVPIICCGEPMEELIAKTHDVLNEKHVPAVQIENDKVHVTVGTTVHPMESKHFIEWIVLETSAGQQMVRLESNMPPKASFYLNMGEVPKTVYAYCNVHSLWKFDIANS